MRFLTTALLWLLFVVARANDGVFYVNGNQLVPLQETDIAVTKEVLTISLCDDGYAKVDVLYEFQNRGAAKTVDMGFEAQAPYNDYDEGKLTANSKHPFIKDFTVTMNGSPLACRNAIVESGSATEVTDFVPLDMKVWREPTADDEEAWGNNLISTKTGESMNYSYAYLFKAAFRAGTNTVHHTYRYKMSYGIGRTFEVPYWLRPAMRWANGQIDDFTLRIKAENTAKHFCLTDNLFKAASFVVTQGKGKVRKSSNSSGLTFVEVALRNGTVEWHAKNFRPSDDMEIVSADTYFDYDKEYPLGTFYDRSDQYVPDWYNMGAGLDKRILRNLPYANRGYVFKDQGLQTYFNQFFWYMPDPTWKSDTSDFTKREWRLINNGE